MINYVFHPSGKEKVLHGLSQSFRIMRLISLFLAISCLHLSAASLSQTVTLDVKQRPIPQVLEAIESQTGYVVVYNDQYINQHMLVSLRVKDQPLQTVLNDLLIPRGLLYEIKEKIIAIKGVEPSATPIRQQGQVTISGRVFEVNDPPIPLPGATITVVGKSRQVVTDSDGNFQLTGVSSDVSLMISMVGYKSQTYTVREERTNLIFSLEKDLTPIEEVIVTGFSRQKRREIASSVSTVNMDNFTNKPVTQLSQALQGGSTGITVQQQSGVVGSDQATIRIRGVATLNDASPLIVIDGIPGDMNNLDPNTVESINILKDAAAASMYGARGANGVIVITTKRGVAGVVNVDYNGYYGLQQPLNAPKFVDGPTYMRMRNQVDINEGRAPGFSAEAIRITADQSDPVNYPDTRWWDETVRSNVPIQQHSILVSGGNTAARFMVNVNHTRQLGQLKDLGNRPASIFGRTTARINTTVDLTRNLFVYTDVFASRSDQTQPYVGGNDRNTNYLYGKIFAIPPTIVSRYPDRPADQTPDYIPDGYTFYGPFGELWNPIATLEQGGTSTRTNDQATINIRPQWNITDALTLHGQLSYNVTSGLDKHDQLDYLFFNYENFGLEGTTNFVKTATLDRRTNYFYWGGNLDYNKTFGLHNVNAILGYTQELETKNNWDDIALRSIWLKGIYSYDERYLLEVGLRRDGSSIFGPGHKWGNMPAVAVGWNIDREPFFHSGVILNWKLRASYGTAGNNRISPYLYQNLIGSNGLPTVFGNAALRWERTTTFNAASDISFAAGFDFTAEWFDKKTTDILIRSDQLFTAGIGMNSQSDANISPYFNAGSARVKGYEFAINYKKQLTDRFRFTANLGYTKLHSEILELIEPGVPIISGNTILMEGKALRENYGFRTDGLLQQEDIDNPEIVKFSGQRAGEIRFLDTNGDGILDNDDRVPLGNTEPTDIFFGGFGFVYGAWDFDALVSGQSGSDLFYTGILANPFTGNIGTQSTPQIYQQDTWTPENTDASLPIMLASAPRFSDFYQRNADFLRVRYIQLGYTLPSAFVNSKLRAKSVRLYVNAQNLFTFTSLKMMDPEAGVSSGETVGPTRIFSFGLNAKF